MTWQWADWAAPHHAVTAAAAKPAGAPPAAAAAAKPAGAPPAAAAAAKAGGHVGGNAAAADPQAASEYLDAAYRRLKADAELVLATTGGEVILCCACGRITGDGHRGAHGSKMDYWRDPRIGSFNQAFYSIWSIWSKIPEEDRMEACSYLEAIWQAGQVHGEIMADFYGGWRQHCKELKRPDWVAQVPWPPYSAYNAPPGIVVGHADPPGVQVGPAGAAHPPPPLQQVLGQTPAAMQATVARLEDRIQRLERSMTALLDRLQIRDLETEERDL
jgi:hypothetical protein